MTEDRSICTFFGKSPTGFDVEIRAEFSDIAHLATIESALKKAGYMPSQRFAPPAYGGGGKNKRPDTPPPPGIRIPNCQPCSKDGPVAMKYIKYKKDGATADDGAKARGLEDGWKDMWVCPNDKLCVLVTSGKSDKAYADFHMTPELKPGEAALNGKVVVSGPNTEPAGIPGDRPMTAVENVAFWKGTRDMGYTRDQVFDVAADVLMGQGPAMKDTEFAKVANKSKLSVHKVFVRLKEMHEAGGTSGA